MHFELRLEWRGMLKTWAVAEEPVLDPVTRRVAVEADDLPMTYTASGTAGLPTGAGPVEIWDRGAWAPVSPRLVDEQLAAGHLKFVLAGDRLQGGFALIRTQGASKDDEGRTWQLVKERDAHASGSLTAPSATPRALRDKRVPVPRADTTDAPRAAPDGHHRNQPTRSARPLAVKRVAAKRADQPPVTKRGKVPPGSKLAVPRLTHPDRVLWPVEQDQPAVTKADLAAYYERVAPLLLPQVAGRPLSMVRTPDGIGAERFFQRHASVGLSSLLRRIRIEGQPKSFLMVEDVEGLQALAQLGVTELHPWGAKADRPEVPDRLVFDLDPGCDVAFATVRAAARQLRDLLAAMGLRGFAKLTGGKGVHVVVPLSTPRRGASPDWAQAKEFALATCNVLERENPGDFTTRMAKADRVGRIFLDYLRNDRLSTAVAAWSPRARPGAPIARPVSWEALARTGSADRFHVADFLAGRVPPDPWANFDAAARPLAPAIRALAKMN